MRGVLERSAIFSECLKFRYLLSVSWDSSLPVMYWLMLNPSTATEMENDPTVERCERRAREMGFGGIVILNIFAFRATDPKDMKKQENPVGEQNEYYIKNSLDCINMQFQSTGMDEKLSRIYCGWGNYGVWKNRQDEVIKMIKESNVTAVCLKQNKNGTPKHPLYCAYSDEFKEMENI